MLISVIFLPNSFFRKISFIDRVDFTRESHNPNIKNYHYIRLALSRKIIRINFLIFFYT
jgi:hypothetical protein